MFDSSLVNDSLISDPNPTTMQTLIFGTTNEAKVLQIQGALKPIGVVVSSLPESARAIKVVEDGETAQENARKKAMAYSRALDEPVLSMDNALFLDGLNPEEQPGIHVRRIGNPNERPSDGELLTHYSKLIARLGGKVSGRWEFALCYARPDGNYEEKTIISPRIFISEPSVRVISGYPLESIQIEPASGKYISEMSQDEQDAFWQRAIGSELAEFIQSIRD